MGSPTGCHQTLLHLSGDPHPDSRNTSKVILAHQIRLDPTPRQEDYFRRACGTARFTYNWALAEWKRLYEAGEKPNGRMLRVKFNAIRKTEFPWTYEVHRDCTSRPFDQLQKAFQGFFRRVKAGQKPGYPKFKKKGQCKDSFYLANDAIQFEEQKIWFPRIGWIKTREALRLDGKVLGASVTRSANQWHISIQVNVGELHKERTGDGIIGIDLGIRSSITLSTGEVIQGPKALRKSLKKLRRLSRNHSRKEKGSSNRRKMSLKLARLHLRISNIRKDHLHKLTTRLVRENQAIGIEDLKVNGMVRNRKLARSISDEGWGTFRWMLEYKALICQASLKVHDRWYPSSKKCSRCGNVKKVFSLSERVYRCDVCGLTIDRDLNASKNLVPEGIGEFKPVERVALAEVSTLVKLSSLKQEPSVCEPMVVAV